MPLTGDLHAGVAVVDDEESGRRQLQTVLLLEVLGRPGSRQGDRIQELLLGMWRRGILIKVVLHLKGPLPLDMSALQESVGPPSSL